MNSFKSNVVPLLTVRLTVNSSICELSLHSIKKSVFFNDRALFFYYISDNQDLEMLESHQETPYPRQLITKVDPPTLTLVTHCPNFLENPFKNYYGKTYLKLDTSGTKLDDPTNQKLFDQFLDAILLELQPLDLSKSQFLGLCNEIYEQKRLIDTLDWLNSL